MDYKKQAEDFLRITNTKMEVVKAEPQKKPNWAKEGEKHGINYKITLTNKRHSYTFDFCDSVYNAEVIEAIEKYEKRTFLQTREDYKREDILKKHGLLSKVRATHSKDRGDIVKEFEPNAYSVLACLSPLYEDSFKDFCGAFGYDEDSITAERIYRACIEQDRNIRKLWDISELEKLGKIQ